MAVVVNKPIPEFDSVATSGIKVSNQTHLGQTIVLYFYPKDNTPGCTTEALDFTALEFDLLMHFAQHPGHVYSHSQLLSAVWGYSHDGYEHTVTTHINRLRAKLEADPMKPEYILTVRGAGYKMREAPAAQA